MRQGTHPRHVFRVVNTSDVPLALSSVRASAACVAGSVDRKMLRPNEAARVEVAVDTRRFVGAKTMRLYLTTDNGTTTETLTFAVTAHSDEGRPR